MATLDIGRFLFETYQQRKLMPIISGKVNSKVVQQVVKELKKRELKQYEIADKFNISPQMVSKIKAQSNIDSDRKRRKSLTKHEIKYIKRSLNKGTRVSVLAERYNVNEMVIHRIKNELTRKNS